MTQKSTNPNTIIHSTKKTGRLHACTLGTLLLATYPLALIAPAPLKIPLRFIISIPTLAIACLAALCFTLLHNIEVCENRKVRLIRIYLLGTLLWGVATNALTPGGAPESLFSQIALFAIPAFYMSAPASVALHGLTPILAATWGLHVLHAASDIVIGAEPVGLAGNRNWMASLAIALVPWGWLALKKIKHSKKNHRHPLLFNIIIIGTASSALLVAWHGRSRAAWLVLGAYLMLHGLGGKLNRRLKLAIAAGGTAVAVILILRNPQLPQQLAGADDIRPTLWRSTIELIADHPITGVGAGRFRAVFPKYRGIDFMRSAKAGAVNDHPHNELLNVAAELGLPMAIAWAILVLPPLMIQPNPDKLTRTAHFTAFIIVGHAMLDKTLVQQPTALAGLICLGICWRPQIFNKKTPNAEQPNKTAEQNGMKKLRPIAMCAIATACLFLSIRSLRSTINLRQGLTLENKGGNFNAAYNAYARAAKINSTDIRADAYAGTIAVRQLRNPQVALKHFAKVIEKEPDYGHVNRWSGMALGMLGRHKAAAPFFRRDAELFPFFEPSAFNYYQNACFRKNAANIKQARSMLRRSRIETVRRELGAEQMQQAAQRLLQALKNTDPNQILFNINVLTAQIRRPGIDPALVHKPSKVILADINKSADFNKSDIEWLVNRFHAMQSIPNSLPNIKQPSALECTVRGQALQDVLSIFENTHLPNL